MESKQFVGIQMLEVSWAFIKEQLRVVDSWFLIAFVSFLALLGCMLGGILLMPIIAFIGGIFQENIGRFPEILVWSALMAFVGILIMWAIALFVLYKTLKYCMGYWNMTTLNSLDVALGRPMRKFEQKDDRLSFIILFILVGFLTIVGFTLLIIPGFIFMVRTSMAYPIMLEEKCSPLQAISKSFDMTRGNFLPLGISLGVFHVLFLLPLLNIINIFVPFVSWNIASLYAQLKNK